MSPNMKKTKAVKTKNCRYHLAGRCTKGSRCLFRHPRLGKKAVTICMFDSRPNGCVKEDCQFVHMKGRPGHKSYLEEAHDLRRVLERSEKSDRVASSSETLLLDSDRNSPEYNSAFTGELSSSSREEKRSREVLLVSGAQYTIKDSAANPETRHPDLLRVCYGEKVTFLTHCRLPGCPSHCHHVRVRNELDEVGYIGISQVNGKIIPRRCCSQLFELEYQYMEHLVMEHFYEKLKTFLLGFNNVENDGQSYRCPEGCSDSFDNLDDLILHYGAFEHSKVISLVFQHAELSESKGGEGENRRERTQGGLRELTQEIDIYKETNKDLQSQIQNLESQLSQYKSKMEKTSGNLEMMEAERDQLDEEKHQMKMQMDQKLVSKDSEIFDLRKELNNNNESYRELQQTKSALEEKDAKLSKALIDKEKLSNDFDSAGTRIKNLECVINRLNDNFKILKNELSKKDDIITHQEKDILPFVKIYFESLQHK